MSSRSALLASASRFASLFPGPKAAKTEEDERARRAGESDDDYNKRMEEQDNKERAAEREKKDGESDEEYAARLKALDEEDEEDEEEQDKEKAAKATALGVAAERKRWTETLASPEAVGRGALACSLLADHDMTSAQICAILKVTPAEKQGAATPLAARMAAAAIAAPGPGGAEAPKAGSTAATVAAVVAAAAKARGESPAIAAK